MRVLIACETSGIARARAAIQQHTLHMIMTERPMTSLEQLISRRDRAAAKAHKAGEEHRAAKREINQWGRDQVKRALAKKGITPKKTIVRMKVRKTRKDRIILEQTECLLSMIGTVDPPTMEHGALGPNASSSRMWWCAEIYWQNIRKDGTPGAMHDSCVIQGDTLADLVGKIEYVRDLE